MRVFSFASDKLFTQSVSPNRNANLSLADSLRKKFPQSPLINTDQFTRQHPQQPLTHSPQFGVVLEPNTLTFEVLDLKRNAAIDAAQQAGRIVADHFNEPVTALEKADKSPVTRTDHAASNAIITILKSYFPDDPVITEESVSPESDHSELSQFNAGSANCPPKTGWVVDPLDGTKNFAKGFPVMGVMLAYFYNGNPVIGVIHDPLTQRTISAIYMEQPEQPPHIYSEVTPAFREMHQLNLAEKVIPETPKAFFTTFSPKLASSKTQPFYADPNWTQRRPGNASREISDVALGITDVAAERDLSIWDIAPGYVLMKAAGGELLDINTWKEPDFRKLNVTDGKISYIAGSAQILNHIQDIIKKRPAA